MLFRRIVFLFCLITLLGVVACQDNAQASVPTPAPLARVDQPTATPLPLPSPTPTPTASNTPDHSPTPGPSPTASPTASRTPIPTNTAVPTITPTSIPQVDPTLAVTGTITWLEGVPTPPTAVPSPVPTFEIPDDVTNILLLGSDAPIGSNNANTRSDTILIVSINRSEKIASILSIPRDLYVYMPGRIMEKITSATALGGVDLLKQTILYNFGVPIHYYARVDFDGFKDAVDAIGGVDINVSCRLQDWRLISPELDPALEENWAQFALEPGVHHMDGDLALWYARSRLTTSDFDRGRRQQQVLRALLNQGVDLGMVSQVPALWQTFQDTVDTDMDIGRILQLAAIAPAVRENGVQHLYLAGKTQPWTVPVSNSSAQLPIWEGDNMMQETFTRLFLPPALNRGTSAPIYVEIINATNNPDLATLAADNLAWYGFAPIIGEAQPQEGATTQLRYFQPSFKQAYEWLISWVFGQRISEIETVDDGSLEYNYQVILGDDYDPCLNQMFAPQAFLPEEQQPTSP